ncbi:hypothetical protein BDV34DRAFT_200095, partial [Aspergillus parasiticus]
MSNGNYATRLSSNATNDPLPSTFYLFIYLFIYFYFFEERRGFCSCQIHVI